MSHIWMCSCERVWGKKKTSRTTSFLDSSWFHVFFCISMFVSVTKKIGQHSTKCLSKPAQACIAQAYAIYYIYVYSLTLMCNYSYSQLTTFTLFNKNKNNIEATQSVVS